METSLCTFIDIFNKEIDLGDGKNIRPQKIIIPIIQRDYAQGRDSSEINRVRARFLDALYKAVTENPVTLDFIYGDIDDEGILTPLDGQQRLTTLYLFHWYAAKKDKVPAEKTDFLKNFSYEIRPDARDFCKCLVEFSPDINEKILSDEIEDQAWFPLNWRKDPTVDSMLRMLDAIHEKFFNVQNLWEKLEGGAIYFHFLSIKNIGLTDEIYITMNSRGKPLTDFEHFKAEFKSRLDKLDENISRRIIQKIDTTWTDLLWEFRGADNLIDDMFLNYFRFICDILRYKRGGTSQGKSYDEFDLLEEFFTEGNVIDNINFLEKSFDCWCDVGDIEKFFDERVSLGDRTKRGVNHHQPGKIIVYFDEKNIFKSCLKFYGKTKDGRVRNFSLDKTVMLYAFLIHLMNKNNNAELHDPEFRRRIRVVNNLVNNSADELSDSESRRGGNRLPAILKQVESIIYNEKILTLEREPNFNSYQLSEERKKLEWTAQNPSLAESLFELEDHYLLYGQIAIMGLENQKYFARFISLFNCDYDKINCALITLGDYFQNSGQRYQLGTQNYKSWQNLFHKSSVNKNFETTKDNLINLLSSAEKFSDDVLDKIISDYLADCENRNFYEWSYYYIKYPVFRPNRYGKYYWKDFDAEPYKFIALWTEKRLSENAYQPFLKALENIFRAKNVSYYFSEEVIVIDSSFFITCENSAYVLHDLNTYTETARLDINQTDGVDIENRIEKFRHWEGKNFLL